MYIQCNTFPLGNSQISQKQWSSYRVYHHPCESYWRRVSLLSPSGYTTGRSSSAFRTSNVKSQGYGERQRVPRAIRIWREFRVESQWRRVSTKARSLTLRLSKATPKDTGLARACSGLGALLHLSRPIASHCDRTRPSPSVLSYFAAGWVVYREAFSGRASRKYQGARHSREKPRASPTVWRQGMIWPWLLDGWPVTPQPSTGLWAPFNNCVAKEMLGLEAGKSVCPSLQWLLFLQSLHLEPPPSLFGPERSRVQQQPS